jgi:MFS family permease
MMNWPYVIAALIVGTMGWLLYLTGLPVIGLVAGAGTGVVLGYIASGLMTAAWAPPVLAGLGGVIGGALGFWTIRSLQLYLFFTVGAGLGGALGYHLLGMTAVTRLARPNDLAMFLVVALAALAGGLLCVKLRRYLVAAITSVTGALLLAPGLPEAWRAPGLVIGLVVFLAIQVGLVRKFVDQETFDRRARIRARKEEEEEEEESDE